MKRLIFLYPSFMPLAGLDVIWPDAVTESLMMDLVL